MRKTSKKQQKSLQKLLIAGVVLLLLFLLEKINPGLYGDLFGEEFTYEKSSTPISAEAAALDADKTMVVHFIDVGQGDAALITMPDGKNMLIDAGTNDAETQLLAYLERYEITTLDYAVFTHPHEDHIGGADKVLAAYPVETVLMPDADATSATYEKLLNAMESQGVSAILAEPGDTYTLGEASFTILAPESPSSEDLNNASIVLKLTYGETSFLFTGDAETPVEREILDRFSVSEIRADVLKLGHHGSSTSTCETFLDAVSPSVAIISCGEGNSYGHPHKETIEKLTEREIPYYGTDDYGSIRIYSDGETLVLEKDKN